LAYLRIIVNSNDNLSFNRIINFPPRGIGKTSIDKINNHLNENNINYFELDVDLLPIGPKQKNELKTFLDFIKKIQLNKDKPAIDILLDIINEIDLKNYYLNQPNIENHERWKNIEELITSIDEYSNQNKDKNLSDFLEEVSLLTDLDRHNKDYDSITLMTIHSAKGLEYSLVIIVGLEEGLFPITSYNSLDNDIDEERRLFYVASTRAMKELVLSYANKRIKYGYETVLSVKSRFIDEIPLELLDISNAKGLSKNTFSQTRDFRYKAEYSNKNQFTKGSSSSSGVLKVGNNVNHKIFGNGKIIEISGIGDLQKISIRFSGNVIKNLIRKYANLTKID